MLVGREENLLFRWSRLFYEIASKLVLPTFCAQFIILSCFGALAHAQQGPATEGRRGVGGIIRVDPSGRATEEELELPPEETARDPVEVDLPPIPPVPEEEKRQLPLIRVYVEKIEIEGTTVLSEEEQAELTENYTGREITTEDLEDLRRKLTLVYIKKGYINSGAVIPDQTVADGIIRIRVIEGQLTLIKMEGNRWFRTNRLKNKIRLGADPPLDVKRLQKELQLLEQDPRIERINAELRPGMKPGESELNVRVEEQTPYRFWLTFDNYQAPTIGAERGRIIGRHMNLLGFGDTLRVMYGRSEGVDPQLDVSYSFPLTRRDTTLTLQYRMNDYTVVEQRFVPLDILSKADIGGIALRHPFYRSLKQEFALSLAGEYQHVESFLLGEGFSFFLGAEDGESTVTALRFSQEWTYRSQKQVFAVRSRFSFGIDAFGATIHESGLPDGQFFSWLGQFQWARRMNFLDTQLILRTDLQVADDSLLPLEQIAVGGRYTVRGYRENLMVRDNGLIASLELRIPVIRNRVWADFIQLTPFVDFGKAWNNDLPTPDPKDISSSGIGMQWAVTFRKPIRIRPQFEVYWGYAFRDLGVETQDWNLQDDGVHLQFSLEVL